MCELESLSDISYLRPKPKPKPKSNLNLISAVPSKH